MCIIMVKQIILARLILEETGLSVDSETSTGTVICTPLVAAPKARYHAEVNAVYIISQQTVLAIMQYVWN